MKNKIATIKARLQGLLVAFSVFSTLTSFGQQIRAAATAQDAPVEVARAARLQSADSSGSGVSEGGSTWVRLFRQASRSIKKIRSVRDNARKVVRIGRRLRESTGLVPRISCLVPLFMATGRIVQAPLAARIIVSSDSRTSVRRQIMSANHMYASAASHCKLATAM